MILVIIFLFTNISVIDEGCFNSSDAENDQRFKKLLLSCRENLKQLKMVEKSLLAEMKETEETITVTENQCKQVVQQIPKIVEFEKIEEEKVTCNCFCLST